MKKVEHDLEQELKIQLPTEKDTDKKLVNLPTEDWKDSGV